MTARRDIMRRRGPMALAAFLLVQSTAALFFVGDAVSDLLIDPGAPHTIFEALVALALFLGVGFGAWALRQMLEEMRSGARALAVARGELAQSIEAQFIAWGLTPAEKDVALFALKGMEVAEIAQLRGAAAGTVRVQLTHVYAKAGVSNRAQFAAWFVEDLLG
jgi:DNA-binding CsgD family transcriptional regulator